MGKEFRKRIADFLSEYIDVNEPGIGYDDERVIEQGIGILVYEGIFGVEELQKEALREQNVLIPLDFIKTCAKRSCVL